MSYKIEKGSFSINPKETKISLDGKKFVNLSKVNKKEIKINQSDASTLNFTILKKGQHKVQIEILDNKGHSVKSTPITIKIDKSKPKPVTSGKDLVSKRPRIFGTVEKGCTVTIQDKNGKIIGIDTVHNDVKWEIIPSLDLSYGEQLLYIFQTNQAGTKSDTIKHQIFIVTAATEIDGKRCSDDFDVNRKFMIKNTFLVNLKISTNDRSKTVGKFFFTNSTRYNLKELSKKKDSDWTPLGLV